MGWDFKRGAKKSDIVSDILVPSDYIVGPNSYSRHPEGSRVQVNVVAYKLIGNNLWVVWHSLVHGPGGEIAVDGNWISLYLLERSSFGWGYKPIDESMGPYELNCPVRFFDLAPLPEGPYAAEWRDKVRAFHNQVAA